MASGAKTVSAQETLPPKPFGLELGPVAFAVSCFVLVWGVSYIIWRLFADSQVGVWKFYPQPFSVYLFWGIMVVVFFGFNCGMAGFNKLKQPASGLLATALTLALSFAIPWLFIFGYGKYDPAFTADKFTGYGPTAMIVLIGFYGFGGMATTLAGWPWSDRMEQPWSGLAQIATGGMISLLLYMFLIYPCYATWTAPNRVLLPLPTAIGWFYSVIVVWLTTADQTDNWPWMACGSRAKTAIIGFFGNFVLGTALYFAMVPLLRRVLIPADAVEKIGGAFNLWPAQIGVCIVNVGIFWMLCAGNWPTKFSPGVNRLLRVVITWALGIVVFVIYTRWFSARVLHEAQLIPGFGGDPLGWFDLLNYVMLIYMVYFGAYGLVKKQA